MKKLTFHRLNRVINQQNEEIKRLEEVIEDLEKQIAGLLDYNRRNAIDIRAYNDIIDDMIDGGCPCKMCNDYAECEKAEKDGKACKEWYLTFAIQEEGGAADVGCESVSGESIESGEGTQDPESETGAL